LYTDLARHAEHKAIESLRTPVAAPPVPAMPIQEVRF
jgi:hypothetical protein